MKRVLPTEAKQLLDAGWQYLDVRTENEFSAGHPAGAFNVPFPGPKFLATVKAVFPVDSKLVVGCMAGGRSMKAAAELEAAGYSNLVDQTAGFGGRPDAKGWAGENLPTSSGAPAGHSFADLAKKAAI